MKLCGACGGGGDFTRCDRHGTGTTVTEVCNRCEGTGEGDYDNGLTLAQLLAARSRLDARKFAHAVDLAEPPAREFVAHTPDEPVPELGIGVRVTMPAPGTTEIDVAYESGLVERVFTDGRWNPGLGAEESAEPRGGVESPEVVPVPSVVIDFQGVASGVEGSLGPRLTIPWDELGRLINAGVVALRYDVRGGARLGVTEPVDRPAEAPDWPVEYDEVWGAATDTVRRQASRRLVRGVLERKRVREGNLGSD